MELRGDKPARPTTINGSKGLTIREHFASMAMQGIYSSEVALNSLVKFYDVRDGGAKIEDCIAIEAVKMADALIEELNKPKQ